MLSLFEIGQGNIFLSNMFLKFKHIRAKTISDVCKKASDAIDNHGKVVIKCQLNQS